MSNLRGHIVLAVMLSSAAAALTDLRPPSLEDTASFIAATVRQHHAVPVLFDDDERLWRHEIAFTGCSVETRVSSEVNRLGAWTSQTRIARWRLHDLDGEAIQVIDETSSGPRAFLVALPCEARRACVDRATQGRDDAVRLPFTSALMARRVAAAFRYATTVCRDRLVAGTIVE